MLRSDDTEFDWSELASGDPIDARLIAAPFPLPLDRNDSLIES
jgi:hypothetical protein